MPVERARITAMEEETAKAAGVAWSSKILRVLGLMIALGVGVLLLAFPWLPYWTQNFFSDWGAEWHSVWMNPYFRGAISGLGLVNVYISLSDCVRLIRAPGPRP